MRKTVEAILEGLNHSTSINEGAYDNLLKSYNDKFSKLDKNIVCTNVSCKHNTYTFTVLDKKSKTEFTWNNGATGYTSSIEANTSDKSKRFHYYLNSIDKDREIVDYISKYRDLSKKADKVTKSLDKIYKSLGDIKNELDSIDLSEEDFNMIISNNYKREVVKELKSFLQKVERYI